MNGGSKGSKATRRIAGSGVTRPANPGPTILAISWPSENRLHSRRLQAIAFDPGRGRCLSRSRAGDEGFVVRGCVDSPCRFVDHSNADLKTSGQDSQLLEAFNGL